MLWALLASEDRMMKILIVIMLSLAITACSGSARTSSGGSVRLTCRAERSTFEGYTGIAVSYTSNVLAQLKNQRGNILIPSQRTPGQTANGIDFVALAYFESSTLTSGSYTVEVSSGGRTITTYDLTLSRNLSPSITIFCS